MANTITFTPINDGAFFTIEEINENFRAVATVLNAKLDVAIGQVRDAILVGEQRVVRTSDPVILHDSAYADLIGDVSVNYKRVRNLREGTAAQDAITVAQAREIVA